ncbi:hypothetical protein BC629DRAFT_1727579 [Irpex lacteus]|nr:hypothetical protein BC629DRAFT_1727579 [Irpex lacteus]
MSAISGLPPIQPGFMIGGKKLRQVIRRISWRNPPNKVYYESAPSSSVSSGFLDEMDLFSVTEPEVSRSSSPSSSGPLSGQITDTALDASTSFTPSPIPPNLTLPHLPYEILDCIIRDTPEDWISCSLVSRQWRAVACAHIFRGLTISGTIMLENPDWLAFWTTTPSMAINVQYLLLSDCTINLGYLDALLSSFASLQSLEMQYFYLSKTTNRRPRHTHRIQDLHLIPRSDDPWFDDVTDILSLFSEIDSFYSFESYRSAPTVDVLGKVQDVIAHGCRGKLQIRSLSPSRNVCGYTCTLPDWNSCVALPDVVGHSGKPRYLLHPWIMNLLLSASLGVVIGSYGRRTTIVRRPSSRWAGRMYQPGKIEIMALIPSHRLRKVVFRIACNGGVHIDDPQRLPWGAMKDVCCALSNLESIEIDMGGEEGRTNQFAEVLSSFVFEEVGLWACTLALTQWQALTEG